MSLREQNIKIEICFKIPLDKYTDYNLYYRRKLKSSREGGGEETLSRSTRLNESPLFQRGINLAAAYTRLLASLRIYRYR